jgi:flagellar biosynthetic protein FlhB
MVEPGQSIPFDLYAAVAGILAYLYRQKVEERLRQDRQTKEKAQQAAEREQRAAKVGTMGMVAMRGFGGGM